MDSKDKTAIPLAPCIYSAHEEPGCHSPCDGIDCESILDDTFEIESTHWCWNKLQQLYVV
jgi:hypothetical protein